MKSPHHMIDGEYIKEWLVLGPFFTDDLEKDFLADVGGKANIEPKEGDTARSLVAISASALAHEQKRYLESGFDDFIPKPFKTQQVYTCLASLLHLEYVFETTDSPLTSWQHVLREIVLPKDLYERLKGAAEISSVTELTSYLQEIESLGEAGQCLAEHLREPIRNDDMETILNLLSEIRIDFGSGT